MLLPGYKRAGGRTFQSDIYLGPSAGRAVRARLLAMLDSLRTTGSVVS
ncbi:MAG TPA: hypothetical protein VG294_00965 [Solirubrobacteraceae bacterium]|jgi:hypothetical protein|nr:hypothetical protein [Solirubrobacteraceae bacterium]